jgi:3-hydroxyisobutyrate dehydrogenase-like beta-hydroxyacid dehydrogenase
MAARVGFVGVGEMGRPMVERLIRGGFDVSLYARRTAALESFEGRARTVSSMAELASCCDVLSVCVFADADVEEVLSGPNGALRGVAGDLIVLVHSTVHPSTCVRLAERARDHGVELLDAPVSGGSPLAETGQLVTMIGGDRATLETARPVLQAFSGEIFHLGPVGSGQIAKLINNLMFAAQMGVVCDAFDLAARTGLDGNALLDVVQHASGGSRAAAVYRRLSPFEKLLEVCQPLRKDVEIVEELLADKGGMPLALRDAVERFVHLL